MQGQCRRQQCKFEQILCLIAFFLENIVVHKRTKEASRHTSSVDVPASLKLSISLSSLPIRSLLTSGRVVMHLTDLRSMWATFKTRRIRLDADLAALCNPKMNKWPSTYRLRTSTTYWPTSCSASSSSSRLIPSLRATRRTFHASSGARAPPLRSNQQDKSPRRRSIFKSSGRASRCKRCRVRQGP